MKTRYLFMLSVLTGLLFSQDVIAQNSHRPISRAEFELKMDMRKLWEDHIVWTRNVIFNIIDDLPGTTEAVNRLLSNQDDIGNAFKPFYGEVIGDSIASLFRVHITTAADVLVALNANDIAAFTIANQIWYDNGEDIVDYLHSINPYYDLAELDDMIDMHLELTEDEAVARNDQDYAADVLAYDAIHDEILEMSDFLADGIIAQFPNMFRNNSHQHLSQQVVLSDNEILLSQNIPNPFADQTVISYFIPENVRTAEMIFVNNSGLVIKTVSLSQRGEGEITVTSDNLRSGVYSYSIIADGKIIGPMKMIH
jgi:hypothetical protein